MGIEAETRGVMRVTADSGRGGSGERNRGKAQGPGAGFLLTCVVIDPSAGAYLEANKIVVDLLVDDPLNSAQKVLGCAITCTYRIQVLPPEHVVKEPLLEQSYVESGSPGVYQRECRFYLEKKGGLKFASRMLELGFPALSTIMSILQPVCLIVDAYRYTAATTARHASFPQMRWNETADTKLSRKHTAEKMGETSVLPASNPPHV